VLEGSQGNRLRRFGCQGGAADLAKGVETRDVLVLGVCRALLPGL